MNEQVQHALQNDRTIDITTTGARSRLPRRVEIWFHRVDGRYWIAGLPGRRGWLANLKTNPQFTVHLKQSAHADLAATARLVDDPGERERIFTQIAPAVGMRGADLIGSPSPLVEFTINDGRGS